jgi:membrane protein DedA with SNARE-associated domain
MVTTFFHFLHYLESAFNTTNPPGLIILFALAVITDIGVPVPFLLDTVLMLTAYKVLISGHPHWTPVIMIVIMLFLGRQVGSGILYLMSRYLGNAFLNWIKKKFPSIGNRLDSLKTRLKHWAPLVVVTGRLTPGLLQITSVASGTIRMRYDYFALGIALASLIYDGILILLAFVAAHNPKAADVDFTIWLLIVMVVIVCILWPLIFVVIQRNKKKAEAIKP